MIDKAILAFAYIWLNKMINSMGVCASASFCAIKDLERFAFLPAIALAQIITFLVSNHYGKGDWLAIKSTIKKIIILACIMVFSMLALFSIKPELLMQLFDKKGDFSAMTSQIFPLLSVLVFFDLLQLLLAGALRGAGDVKIVMWTRICICLGYFVPISYWLSRLPIRNVTVQFLLIYASFYLGNGLMSVV
jgi:Na+-driven multidrug efflux pump